MSHNIYSLLVPLRGSPTALGQSLLLWHGTEPRPDPALSAASSWASLTPHVAHIYPGEPATALWTLQLSPIDPRMLGLLSAEILVVPYLPH